MATLTRHYMAIETPESLVLRQDEAPSPEDGEVLIEVHYAGINRADLLQRVGLYPVPKGASPIMGLEVSGSVIAVGNAVQHLASGDRVCALVAGGGYASHCLARADHCLKLPDTFDLARAAALPEALLTIWHNVMVLGQLEPGQTLLMHGGSSGIGSLGIQMAKVWGATVLATAGGAAKCSAVAKLGADQVFDYRGASLLEQMHQAGYAGKIDVILDMAGGDFTQINLDLAGLDGRVVCIGMMRGIKAEINLFTVLQKRLTLTGSTLRGMDLASKIRDFEAIRQHIMPSILNATIQPLVHAHYPLAEALAAQHAMQAGEHIGKLILDCRS